MSKRYWAIEDQYVVLRVLGVGGFATVYKAYDRMLRKYAAVKKIHSKYTQDPKIMDMFRTEAINTAKLDHVNIVKVVNFVTDAQHCYIIMDFVSGADLEQLFKKCQEANIAIKPEIALYVLSEIFKALQYAHSFKDELTGESLNFVHQDISPGNMMLHFDGRIKLTDFGIAKAGDATEGGLAGKLSYLSPEQALGEHIGTQSDLYSMGLVLYEALAGRQAYAGEMQEKWNAARAARVDMRPLRERGVPPEVMNILGKLLEKSKERRYQDAGACLDDINDYLSSVDPTEGYKTEYKNLLRTLMASEIAAADQEALEESRIDFDLIETTSSPDGKDDGSSDVEIDQGPDESQLHDEKEKTMIDFVMDQARQYKKLVFSILISATAAFIIFAALDTWLQITPLGKKIYNRINPAALMLESIPSGVNIKILDRDGIDIIEREGYLSQTPTRIDKIQLGSYMVELNHPELGIMRRVLNVTDQSGELLISIAGARTEEDYYLIPFEVEMNIDSNPANASIFLNGRNLGQTPFSGNVEIDVYSVRIEKAGFGSLGLVSPDDPFVPGACILDLSRPVREQGQVDFMFWNLEDGSKEGMRYFSIAGSLWKELEVVSSPPGARLNIKGRTDGEFSATHTTPVKGLALPAGDYEFSLSLPGYSSWRRNVRVDENTSSVMQINLDKSFRLKVVDAATGENLAADVAISGSANLRGKTPMTVSLPAGMARISLTKEPEYEPVVLVRNIEELGGELLIEMELRNPYLQVEFKDYESGRGIDSATVWVNGLYWKQTNAFGVARGYLDPPAGKYELEIRSDSYRSVKRKVDIEPGERVELSIAAGAPTDGTITLDIPASAGDVEVFINGESMGRNSGPFKRIPRGKNQVQIKGGRLGNVVNETVELDGGATAVSLKLEIRGGQGRLIRN